MIWDEVKMKLFPMNCLKMLLTTHFANKIKDALDYQQNEVHCQAVQNKSLILLTR